MAEMVVDSGLGLQITNERVPFIKEALEYANMGLVPAGTYNNRKFREMMVDMASSVDPVMQDVLFDPQTSGGLLICVSPESAEALEKELKEKGMTNTAIIGEVIAEPKERILVN